MPYTVAGTLKLPQSGQPAPGVILKFVALSSISPVLANSESIVVTSSTGAYSIALEYNTYSVFATLYDNKPIACGQIVLNSSVPAGLDLPGLLSGGQYEPPTPAWILQIQAWITSANTSATNAANSAATATQQVVAASAQADRSRVEADRAAQIAGLSTVTDAIFAIALPLPDVWSPLVDSLRVITGKGKEIKVGEEVVLRRCEFERLSAATERQKDGKLRLVPANEPRYEGGALVKERSSTNLYFPHDASVGCTPVGGTAVMGPGSGLLGETQTLKFFEDNTNGSHYLWLRTTGGFVVGESVSVTVELIVHKASFNKFRVGCNDMSATDRTTITMTPDLFGKPITLTFTGVAGNATLRPYVWGFVADASMWQGDGSANFEVLSVQVEKGPPTSLIPTTTAAATRAAEFVWLPGPANSPGYGKSRTYSLEFEVISPSLTGYTPLFCDGAYPTRTFVGVWSDGNLMANNDYVKAFTTQFSFKKRNVISATFDYDGGYVSFSLNGGQVVRSSTPCTIKPGQAEVAYERLEIGSLGGWGHQSSIRIRNFRCWHRPVSDDQLRAIK